MRIGIPTFRRNDMYGIHPDYFNLVEAFGTPVLIAPGTFPEEISALNLEGLVLPGGADVDSKRYSPYLPRYFCQPPDWDLEWFDTQVLPTLISKKFPIFGICRGMQTLNVLMGGSLYRDLRNHPCTNFPFTKTGEDLVHSVSLTYGGTNSKWTNSFHHQSVNKLGNGFEIIGTASDGIVEAIRHTEFPIFGVQWHPERDPSDTWSRKIMKGLFS